MSRKAYKSTKYIVTDDGRVFNSITGYRLKPSLNSGYFRVEMTNNNVRNRQFIHRMVAECFIENPNNKPHVNHKNRNKTDNRVENLEWCTPQENMKHCYETMHLTPWAKSGGPKNSMPDEVKDRIVELFKSGMRPMDIFKEINIGSNSSVYKILGRRGCIVKQKKC